MFLFLVLSSSRNSPFFFFFSSRRRHTRSLRDWSSDVCSSDLIERETGRMQRVVDDMLLLAQMDEGAVPPRLEQVDLDELLLAEARRLHDRGHVAVDASRVSEIG